MAKQAAPGSWTVGNEVLLQTTWGEEIEATVYAFDGTANVLLLKEAGSHNGVANLRLLNAAHVAQTIREVAPATPFDVELPVIDEDRQKKREEKALRQAEADYDRFGVGVSREAQAIFEALSKTLPCKWRKKTIVVLDEVLVPEPYTAASCTTDGRPLTNPKALDRVQLIVRDARTRLGLSQDESSS